MIIKIINKIIWGIKYIRKFFLNIAALVVQLRYKKLIILKKKTFLNDKKIIVVFFITQKQLWCHQTIYEHFLSNDKFEPIVVVFPNEENTIDLKKKSLNDNLIFFKKKNIKTIAGYKEDLNRYICLKEINADIIFYDQPCPGLPKKLLFYEASKTALVCYVPYGFKVANFIQDHFNHELHNCSWIVFAESDWHKRQYIRYGFMRGKNITTSGYPKLDNYLESSANPTSRRGQNYFRKIIWAPHWSINVAGSINFSTFDKNYKLFKEIAKKYTNIYWVFKPHQRLRYYLEETGFMTKKQIQQYFAFWKKLPNGEFYNEADYFNHFKTSHALITDCGSFLAEYLPTKKPILHLVNKETIGFNEIGKKLVISYYKAFNNSDIIKFIEKVVIKNNDYLRKKRLKNLKIVRPNDNGAGKYIVDYIQRKLCK